MTSSVAYFTHFSSFNISGTSADDDDDGGDDGDDDDDDYIYLALNPLFVRGALTNALNALNRR